jgi:superfamily I DNA/RNA helicase
MEYEITPERQTYLDARGYTILTACPGSGKTTSIVYKLQSISRECVKKYHNYSGIACLSFTNKACEEVFGKYKEMHGETLQYPHIVSTIDSFITQYITLPFWYLYPRMTSRPIIVNDDELIDKMLKIQYSTKGEAKERYIKDIAKFGYEIYTKYDPKDFWKEFQGYSFKGELNLSDKESKLYKYADAIFQAKVNRGFINSQDASFIGCYILYKFNNVAKVLAKRFPYIIIDEAQDTSEIHHKIFDKLKNCGVEHIEYIGDLYQSIYQWRNAKPELLEEKINSQDWKHLNLTENRRSNQRIIDLYSFLRKSDDPKITSHGVDDKGIEIFVYRYDNSNTKAVIDHFNSICQNNQLKECFILTRGNGLRNKLIGAIQELKYWKSKVPYLIIEAKADFNDGSMNSAFDKIRHAVADCKFRLTEYVERKDFLKCIEQSIEFNTTIMKFIFNIPTLDLSLYEWTNQTELLIQDTFSLDFKPDFLAHKRIAGETMKILKTKSVNLYYSDKKNNSNGLPVKTIHKVKGATFDAVLLFLSNNSTGKSISLNEFKKKNVFLTEKQRMIYVACSRATQFLSFAVPTSVSEDEIRKILEDNVVIKNINLQESFLSSYS